MVEERIVSTFMHRVLVCSPKGHRSAPLQPKTIPEKMSIIRSHVYPYSITLASFLASLLLPMIALRYDGSITNFMTNIDATSFWENLPKPTIEAAFVFFGWAIFQGLLLELVPGKTIYGPITPAGERPSYVDNGIPCWLITHGLWLLLGPITGLVPFGRLYDMWGSVIATGNVFAVPFCLFLYWKGRTFPSSRDAYVSGFKMFDFFQGVELHPRLFGMNVKQLLNCRVSMNGWSLAFLCFAQAQYDRGMLSSGIIVSSALLVAYLFKFFWWEAGYFASIDIIHDRCGYYIMWGVLCFVPSVYCAPAYFLVEHPTNWSIPTAAALFAVGIGSLVCNYVADLQRQVFRATHGECKIWGKKPEMITAKYTTSDGKEHTSILLCSGFWGWSRHFNYVPELLLSLCICLPGITGAPLAGVYYYFLQTLLIDRANRDDEKCSVKYTKYWTEYCKRVPYKILPFVY